MNLAIEAALASWLRSLDPFEGLAIHTGQSNEEIPGDASALVVACESVEAMSTSLHRATAAILLSTPGTHDLDHHHQLVDALRSAIYSPSGLAESFLPSATLLGASLQTFTETQSSGRWLCTATLTLGLAVI